MNGSEPLFRAVNGAYFAATAVVCGEVRVAAGANVWFGAVVRGDVAPITLHERVNLQDGVIVHCDFGVPQEIEPGVVVGHAAVLHGVRVRADTLVGIGAKLLSGTDIGAECVIAAGCAVTAVDRFVTSTPPSLAGLDSCGAYTPSTNTSRVVASAR